LVERRKGGAEVLRPAVPRDAQLQERFGHRLAGWRVHGVEDVVDLNRLAGLGLGYGGPTLQVGLVASLRPDQLDKLLAQQGLRPDHCTGILAQPNVRLECHADQRAAVVSVVDGEDSPDRYPARRRLRRLQQHVRARDLASTREDTDASLYP